MPLSKQLRISSVNFDVDDDEDAFVDEVDGEDPDDALCANRKSMCSRRPLPAPPCAAVRNCMRVHIHTHTERHREIDYIHFDGENIDFCYDRRSSF